MSEAQGQTQSAEPQSTPSAQPEATAASAAAPSTPPAQSGTLMAKAQDDKPVGGLEGNGQVAKPIENTATNEPVKPVVPEKYELSLSKDSALTPEYLKDFESFAKAKGMTQEQALEMVKRDESLVHKYRDEQSALYQKQVQDWQAKAKADPEYGGEKLNQSAEIARRAMQRFGGDQLSQILETTGYGNHPEVIRMFYKIGQAMGDAQITGGGSNAGREIPLEERFYGRKNK